MCPTVSDFCQVFIGVYNQPAGLGIQGHIGFYPYDRVLKSLRFVAIMQ